MTRTALLASAVQSSPWSVAGPAYTNPRPATDLLMSAYDTGATDPHADVQAAINAAAAVAQATGKARLVMDSRLKYSTAAAPATGPNGQYGVWYIPADLTGKQVFLEIVGIPGAGCVPMSTGGLGGGGTIIEGTSTTVPSWVAGRGLASLIGGPSFIGLNGRTNPSTDGLSGLDFGLKNMTIRVPNSAPYAGVDAGGVQGFEADNVVWDTPQWASNPGIGPGATWGTITLATNPMGVALMLPGSPAQENSRLGHIFVSGYTCGVFMNELGIAHRIDTIGCNVALGMGYAYHPNHIGTFGDYNNVYGISGFDPSNASPIVAPSNGATTAYAIIDFWDKQPVGTQMSASFTRVYDVNDPNNSCPVHAKLVRVDANVGRVIGGHLVNGSGGGLNARWDGRIEDIASRPGVRTAPSMPSSGTDLRNPFWRDALVQISGGTVTQIVVQGGTTGQTSGAVLVPASGCINISYSVAPTWTWQTI